MANLIQRNKTNFVFVNKRVLVNSIPPTFSICEQTSAGLERALTNCVALQWVGIGQPYSGLPPPTLIVTKPRTEPDTPTLPRGSPPGLPSVSNTRTL